MHTPFYRFVVGGIWAVWLVACTVPIDNITNRDRAVTLHSNAVFVAFQDGPVGRWRVLRAEPRQGGLYLFQLFTHTFVVNDRHGRFSLVLACPAEGDDSTEIHHVELYYMTTNELQRLNQLCRQSEESLQTERTIGKVIGIDTDIGEQALISLSDNASVQADDAYGLEVVSGQREILAMRGELQDQVIVAKEFYIERNVSFKQGGWVRRNIDFNNDARTANVVTSPRQVGVGNITLVDNESTWLAQVNLIGESGITLNLATSTENLFNFQSIPLYNNFGDDFLRAGEGHELIVSTFSDTGELLRAAYRLFSARLATDVPPDTPTVINELPNTSQPYFGAFMEYKQTPPYAQFEIRWDANAIVDPYFGTISMYRWELEADSAVLPDALKRISNVRAKRSHWVINISNDWLDVDENGQHIFMLTDPSQFDPPDPNLSDDSSNWRQEWGMRAGSTIVWKLSLLASEANAGDIVHYKLHNRFANNLLLGELIQSGELKP